MSREFAVFGSDRPPVGLSTDGRRALIYHRFDGNSHAGQQANASSWRAEIRYAGILMEISTHAVARVFTNDGEAALLAVARNSEAYIAESAACNSLPDAFIKALSGHVAQPLRLGGNVPAGESGSIVAGIAVYRSAEVNADYIAALIIRLWLGIP